MAVSAIVRKLFVLPFGHMEDQRRRVLDPGLIAGASPRASRSRCPSPCAARAASTIFRLSRFISLSVPWLIRSSRSTRRIPGVEDSRRRVGEHLLAVALDRRPRGLLARVARRNPRSRPASTKLAARRFTSHSNGAIDTSSKSLMSKTILRSGVAKPPKLSRWASPQAQTVRSVEGAAAEVGGLEDRRATVERERGREHPRVADRQQLLEPALLGAQDHVDRIRTVRGRLPGRVVGPGRCVAPRLPHREPFGEGQPVRLFGELRGWPGRRARSAVGRGLGGSGAGGAFEAADLGVVGDIRKDPFAQCACSSTPRVCGSEWCGIGSPSPSSRTDERRRPESGPGVASMSLYRAVVGRDDLVSVMSAGLPRRRCPLLCSRRTLSLLRMPGAPRSATPPAPMRPGAR